MDRELKQAELILYLIEIKKYYLKENNVKETINKLDIKINKLTNDLIN